ncbi:uncharacterized protein RHOBADRAFT_50439 [Rhodotorula graminis WP1]|uniref:F-box domain-containing protein n=1 Tax=Rhodotorula graminis (strain WP1) TaxID=578459 RepID=A0A194SBS9_RHOGW|nr:uncharacterized protein RHOBADRAFT_50439 [Rhodotorula graminis WP1]KPV77905.1 hypothetical protein RHOBADRAFT_50439 [Rhodotorula graminis WP1]
MRSSDKHCATSSAAPPPPPAVRLPPTPPESPALDPHGTLSPALASLPTETLHHVLSYLDPPALAAVACLARTFLPLARAHLYRQLHLRNNRDGQAAPADSSALDARSAALLASLDRHAPALATLVHGLDFDLLSHLGADDVAALLGQVLTLCPSLTALRLGAGSHGHGIGFRGLYRSLALAPPGAAARLRVLDVAACAGAPHTLAMLLVEMPNLVELRIGQCLLEDEDQAVFCAGRAAPCRLETLVARGRLTPTAFAFCTASSGASLRRAVVPLCDKAALDLAPFTALAHVELCVFLAGAPTPFSPAHAQFHPTLSRLSRNLGDTLASLPGGGAGAGAASSPVVVALSGAWDSAVTAPPGSSQAVDLVLHGDLLERIPREGVERVVVRTELNALALTRWLADDAWWGSAASSALSRMADDASTTTSDHERERERDHERPPSPAGSTASAPSVSTCVPSPCGSPSPPPTSSRSLFAQSPHRFPPDVRHLELWQKTSYSGARRDFQARVRERVDERARVRGVEVTWRTYERW